MKEHLYEEIWEDALQDILDIIEEGESKELDISGNEEWFKKVGNRKNYSFRLEMENGRAVNNIGGSAVARDLARILTHNRRFLDLSKGCKIILKLGSDFILKIDIIKGNTHFHREQNKSKSDERMVELDDSVLINGSTQNDLQQVFELDNSKNGSNQSKNTLQTNNILQGGKYRIEGLLGQGGFGITYLAIQSGLGRKVAVKEFFMKGYCGRDENSNRVTIVLEEGRETVKRYREKFLKEARNIARLNHPNIVRIIDVFEENGTAYYVMEYAEGGSLADKVKQSGYLPESVATRYILQVAEALDYIHQKGMNHLDVKPANIMLNEKDEPVLIDFGLSKQYDVVTGNQTSTTPVGISEGYAPMEQYKTGGVGAFSPETDIYALGATFFKLLTGATPPSASDVNEDGVPVDELRTKGVSQTAIDVICKAMEGRKKDRMKSAGSFIDGLKETVSAVPLPQPQVQSQGESQKPDTKVTVLDGETTRLDENNTSVSDNSDSTEFLLPQIESQNESQNIEVEIEDAEATKLEEVVTPLNDFISTESPSTKKYSWKIIGLSTIGLVALFLFFLFNKTSSDQTNDETPGQTFTVNGVSFKMIRVEGGTFQMGATEELGIDYDNEKPVHSVTLNDYMLGETEVTQELWKTVMGTHLYFTGAKNPVKNVSWDDCKKFISKLNSLTGQKFRLPTEAEWEFAARGGNNSKHFKYSGSNNINDVAWYDGNSGSKTHPVGTKAPNELGIYDMTGNVWEWCEDWYGDYRVSAQTNPQGPSQGFNRVYRGGSWRSLARYCPVSGRYGLTPGSRDDTLGFRLAAGGLTDEEMTANIYTLTDDEARTNLSSFKETLVQRGLTFNEVDEVFNKYQEHEDQYENLDEKTSELIETYHEVVEYIRQGDAESLRKFCNGDKQINYRHHLLVFEALAGVVDGKGKLKNYSVPNKKKAEEYFKLHYNSYTKFSDLAIPVGILAAETTPASQSKASTNNSSEKKNNNGGASSNSINSSGER